MIIKDIDVEKLTSFKNFILLVGLILFIDIILIHFSNISIAKLNFDLIKNNIVYSILIVLFYMFYATIIVNIVAYIIRYISIYFKNYEHKNYIHDYTTLEDLSIKYNNTVLYNYINEQRKENIEVEFIGKQMISVAILGICDFFINENSLLKILSHDYNVLIIFASVLIITFGIGIYFNSKFYEVYLDKKIIDFIKNNVNSKNDGTDKNELFS